MFCGRGDVWEKVVRGNGRKAEKQEAAAVQFGSAKVVRQEQEARTEKKSKG